MTGKFAVLCTGRQDWGILRSTCKLIKDDTGIALRLIVGGMACSRRFGYIKGTIEEDGFICHETLEWMPDRGAVSPQFQAGSSAVMVGDALVRQEPEALLLVGDRMETAAAALAATVLRVPIVHLHGGEETQGAFDNSLRHSITKLSHLHLVSHPQHAARVIAMGEDPATVHVVGAPGLDNAHRRDLASVPELENFLGITLQAPVVLVTLHPATLDANSLQDATAVCSVMDSVDATYIISLPNSDPGSEAIRGAFRSSAHKPKRTVVEGMGERLYWGLMRVADAILGNSSSALIEAPVLGLPAVNIGTRQKGRVRAGNVLDVTAESGAVEGALRLALSPEFRDTVANAPSPFGDGRSASRIVEHLRAWVPPHPPIKAWSEVV